jgi:stage V sporulation protein SpoVS
MTSTTDRAHRATERRARMLPLLAVLLLAQQTMFFTWDGRAVTAVRTAGWTILALSCLLILLTGGNLLASREVRALANDDVSRANRAVAIERGFLAAMFTAILVFVVAPFEPLSAQHAAHLVVSIGIAVALLVFALKERQALA